MPQLLTTLLCIAFAYSPSAAAQAGNSATPVPLCPSSPNCVSSADTDNHRIEPLAFTGDAVSAFGRLKTLLTERRDTKVISADALVIRVEFRTALGFVDDGLFVLDAGNSVIHIRSCSRLGYWDLGKNRRRMEEIRSSFNSVSASRIQ